MTKRSSTAERLPELAQAPANDPDPQPAAFALPRLPADAQLPLAALAALFGAADGPCRATHLRGRDDDALLAESYGVDSERVVDGAVTIVVSTARVLAALTPAQRDLVTLDPALLAVALHEAARLDAMRARHGAAAVVCTTVKSSVEAQRAAAHRDAIAQRDVVRVGLAQALGGEDAGDLAPAYDASDDAALARGVDHLADALDAALAGGDDARREQLVRRGLDAGRVHRLRGIASRLREVAAPSAAPEPPVRPRELKVRGGAVLVMLDAVVDAMRAAHRANGAIDLPKFGALAKRYRVTVRRKKDAAPDATTVAKPG